MAESDAISSAKMRLIETGGRAFQDLGLGRIVGQMLVYLYLQPSPCSLDELEKELGLSKASVSIAARQLEQLGLVQQVWVRGERKKFYRSADNIGHALQQGLISQIRQKVKDFGNQLEVTKEILQEHGDENSQEIHFLRQRIARASILQKRLDSILGNPLLRLLAKATKER